MSAFTLTFEVINPAARQKPVAATIQASGPGLIIASTVMEGGVLEGGEEKRIQVPPRPMLVQRSLGESSKVEFQETKLLFELAAGVYLFGCMCHTRAMARAMALLCCGNIYNWSMSIHV